MADGGERSDPVPPAWSPGDAVDDRFSLLERVGEGGSVTVWRARDAATDRTVALKRPRPDRRAAGVRQAFEHRREVLAWLRERDPPAVFPAPVAIPDDAPYLAVEFAPGDSLADTPPATPATRRAALRTVADACEWLHERGRIHCDLRPENARRAADGDLRLVDLGSARQRGRCPDCGTPLTAAWLETGRCDDCHARVQYRDPTADGRPAGYRAPELDADPRLVGPWTDAYGLARLADALAAGGGHPGRPPAGPRADLAPLAPVARPPTPTALLDRVDDRDLW